MRSISTKFSSNYLAVTIQIFALKPSLFLTEAEHYSNFESNQISKRVCSRIIAKHLKFLSNHLIDLFAIGRKGLRSVQPILTALETVGDQWKTLLEARLHPPANSTYFFIHLHYSRFARYLIGLDCFLVLFSNLVILSPIFESTLSRYFSLALKWLILGPTKH